MPRLTEAGLAPIFRPLSQENQLMTADRPMRPEATVRQRDAPSGAKVIAPSPRHGGEKWKGKMFDSLSERLNAVLDRLTRRGALSEADVDAALQEVRRALIEADVALDVARAFTEEAKEARGRDCDHQVGHARPDGR